MSLQLISLRKKWNNCLSEMTVVIKPQPHQKSVPNNQPFLLVVQLLFSHYPIQQTYAVSTSNNYSSNATHIISSLLQFTTHFSNKITYLTYYSFYNSFKKILSNQHIFIVSSHCLIIVVLLNCYTNYFHKNMCWVLLATIIKKLKDFYMDCTQCLKKIMKIS